jgi:hypothetical protein
MLDRLAAVARDALAAVIEARVRVSGAGARLEDLRRSIASAW